MTTPPPSQPSPPQQWGPPPGSAHPVQVSIERADSQNRVLALFSIPFFLARMLAAIPVIIVLYFVGIAFAVVAWIGQWAILFTGHYPTGMHSFGTGVLRWQTKTAAWVYGLTDKYPGFGLGE